ncbi:uncharacterized protein BDV17DRAFT_264785 [Aspergillus undulatus]|uniref:uncharacterized protein n=1 Tax=Aspergillus undulatus TaxID=1810928 RepID=UPI003CCD6EC4
MAALIRAFALLQSDYGQNEARQLVPRQAQFIEPVNGSTKAGFIAMGICGVISFIASLSLFLFLTFRFIFWSRYYKQPLQATAFLLCLHWVAKGAVYYPSAACVLQGWWIQTADPGSRLFVIAIAMHTGAAIFVISEAAWCWLSPAHEDERLWGHYLWIFLAEFGTVVLYRLMFFYLRR